MYSLDISENICTKLRDHTIRDKKLDICMLKGVSCKKVCMLEISLSRSINYSPLQSVKVSQNPCNHMKILTNNRTFVFPIFSRASVS